jgi:Cdc6-like AAA superfamily ATPase
MISPNKLFFPNKSIRRDNKSAFTGRRSMLQEAYRKVGEDGFSALIYGDRGIGKTSFGWQLLELLSGDTSILGTSSKYPECRCIWLQCQDYMDSIEGVLVSLIKESLSPNSFSTEFPSIYNSPEHKDTMQRKYGINLGVISTEFIFKPSPEAGVISKIKSLNAPIHDLFKHVIHLCKKLSPDLPIVVFLDEFDSLPNRIGVGQLIKATDDVCFVIIGIADNIDEIIEDHPSADRKIGNTKYKIPNLESAEVNIIFDKAQETANNEIVFESDFRDQVIFKSNGYPYLVQQFGYFATQAAQDANPDQTPLRVGVTYLQESIKRLFKHKQESKLFKPLIDILESDSKSKNEILRVVGESSISVSIDSIKDRVAGRLKQHVGTNTESLVKANILKRTDNGEVRFANPEARILTQLHFSEENNSNP